ncbi:unnamed protein product [Rhizoctonia solani]|uniref:Peptidase S8/S53 domain-containing protein n=1 Tax=Rhizoctonia solani TaxID=456999 RepID=A0A8H3DUW7_9AGAM|nr:unnamed protein product [Rhizoctonia solani]
MRTSLILSALAFVVPALSAPTVVPITKHAGPVKANSYIVKLKDDASKSAILDLLKAVLKLTGSLITYDACDPDQFNGFTSILKGDALAFVQRMQGVEYIEQDGIVSLVEHEVTGLDHSPHVAGGHHGAVLGRTDDSGGKGVIVYGIDTGIYIEHSCFGGRASFGASFVDISDGKSDMNGHGTRRHGWYGSLQGIWYCHQSQRNCSQRQVIRVGLYLIYSIEGRNFLVLDGSGSGSTSGVIAGVCWAFDHFKKHGKQPSVATMSLGGAPSPALNGAVEKAIKGGLHFTVAAGNNDMSAETSSPANVEVANTIGAVDEKDRKASFSNYGKLIDVWAPGVNITSAWIGSPDAKNTISGTSMATPYVAGILAVALSEYGQMSPAKLSTQLKENGKEIVTFDLESPTGLVAQTTSTHTLARKW